MNFIITNREVIYNSKTKKEEIRPDGKETASASLRFGEYSLKTRQFTLYEDASTLADLNYSIAQPLQTDKGSALFFKTLYQAILSARSQKTTDGKPKADVLLYVHGFNNDLESVKAEFSRLNKKYVEDKKSPIAHIVIFSWPSQSTPSGIPVPLYGYQDDQADAERSGVAFAKGIFKLREFYRQFFSAANQPCGQKVHLMCHSMGNQVLESAMKVIARNTLEVFTEIFLIAADAKYDTFEDNQPLQYLIDMGERVHIYYHEQDAALLISKYTKNTNNRLGAYGRRNKKIVTDIYEVDVSNTVDDATEDWVEKNANHHYHETSSKVIKDIIEVLNGKKVESFRQL